MKRFFALMICIFMLFSFASCKSDDNVSGGESKAVEAAKTIDIEAEADAIISKYSLSGGLRYSSLLTEAGKYLDETLVFDYYDEADFDSVAAYAVYIDQKKPTLPCEFGIFEMKDGADAESFKSFLEARINAKIENAKSYPSVDTEPLKTAKFNIIGKYVWYCAVKGGNDDINSTLEGKLK